MLLSLLIIPIIGLFLIFNPISYDENTNNIYNKERASKMLIHSKNITLIVTGINLLLSLIIFAIFNFSVQEFQFVQEHYNISSFDIYLGIDGISIYFILLTTCIIPIALIANWNSINENEKSLLIIILLLETLLLAVFLVLDVLLFYIFFESILIPLFLLIGIFGSYNKIRAGFYLFLYTLFGSLFLLLAILSMSSIMGAVWWGKSPLCQQLSNSGNTLKLLVPSYIRKIISGWSNYSCTVTSQKMKETEIGYRGSKSVTMNNFTVKEQRVYGSWHGLFSPCLRCTLMGFERNYQIRILSNHINRYTRLYSSKVVQQCLVEKQNLKINPQFLTGFIDAEGCFTISITRDKKYKTGWQVRLFFQISLHEKDKALLEQIQNYFSVGKIYKHGAHSLQFRVCSIKDLAKIVDHLNRYPLITQKRADFELWKKAFNLMLNKEHATIEGLRKTLAIKNSINWGLSPDLKAAFPDIIPMDRPFVKNQTIENPNWLAGFTTGEGCFKINITKSPDRRLGFQCRLGFELAQHTRDEELMRSLIEYLDCGNLYKNREIFSYRVENFSDIKDKIIPFFVKNSIEGIKSKDFEDWCKVAELMKTKAHLTKGGLEQIRKIKAGINTGRIWY